MKFLIPIVVTWLMAVGLARAKIPAQGIHRGVAITISPKVVLTGGSTWLTCRVTPDTRNRVLRFGIMGSERERSERQLDGYQAPITWGPFLFEHLPCGAGPAYCIVSQTDDGEVRAMTFLVVECHPQTGFPE